MQQLGYNLRGRAHDPEIQSQVLAQLARMLCSPEFQNSDRMSTFLQYVVTQSLAGEDASLKEVAIGVAVYGRDPSYNPKTDPVVRTEARRLRERIQRFYEREGVKDQVVIGLPKGGYTAQFEWLPITDSQSEAPIAEPETAGLAVPESCPEGSPGKWRWLSLLACALIGVVIGAAISRPRTGWRERASSADVLNQDAWTDTLTSLPGQELDPTISPDGKMVAFTWNRGGDDFDLYVTPATGGEPRQLTRTAHRDIHPAFSPDGRRIAFLRTSPDAIEVWRINADGGDAARMTEIRWFEWYNWRSDPLLSSGHPGPAWAPDGRSLLLSDIAGSQQGAAIWEFDIATGARKQLTRPEGLSHDFFPAVSPDGSKVACIRQVSASNCDIVLLDRRTGMERRLTRDAQDIRGITWLPDSRSLVFSSARRGVYQLWKISVDAEEPTPISTGGNRVLGPVLSHDGRLLVYVVSRININLWTQPLSARATARPLIQSTGQNLFPRFSPDGRQIVWASDRTGGWEIWIGNRDGSGQRQLTRLSRRSRGRMLGTPRWSPDGRTIAFDARLEGNCAIYLIDVGGGEPRLLERNNFEERNPVFSRDGRNIYFNSNRGARVQIWRRAVDGGQPTRVSTRRGYDAAESPIDGSILFLPALAEPGIWSVRADGTQERILLPTVPFLIRRHWDLAGRSLYFLGHDTEPRTLMRYIPGTAAPERITELDRTLIADMNSLTVSPDEKTLVFARPDILESDLMAVRAEDESKAGIN